MRLRMILLRGSSRRLRPPRNAGAPRSQAVLHLGIPYVFLWHFIVQYAAPLLPKILEISPSISIPVHRSHDFGAWTYQLS